RATRTRSAARPAPTGSAGWTATTRSAASAATTGFSAAAATISSMAVLAGTRSAARRATTPSTPKTVPATSPTEARARTPPSSIHGSTGSWASSATTGDSKKRPAQRGPGRPGPRRSPRMSFPSSFVRLRGDHAPREEDAMKYMLLIHHGDTPLPGSPEWDRLTQDEQQAVPADYQAINETAGVTPGAWMEP